MPTCGLLLKPCRRRTLLSLRRKSLPRTTKEEGTQEARMWYGKPRRRETQGKYARDRIKIPSMCHGERQICKPHQKRDYSLPPVVNKYCFICSPVGWKNTSRSYIFMRHLMFVSNVLVGPYTFGLIMDPTSVLAFRGLCRYSSFLGARLSLVYAKLA